MEASQSEATTVIYIKQSKFIHPKIFDQSDRGVITYNYHSRNNPSKKKSKWLECFNCC
jgi:hypothetical protein